MTSKRALLFSPAEDQVELAVQVGSKIQKRQSNSALKQQKLKVRQTLMNKGFNSATIDLALQENRI
ncbi:MAG: RecX family transcriptional regulator [Pediococcus pentosaceus]|nr:RecX family transcriptional regulator [Pediococcus pentosaceus]